ncbi:MAG: serine/threonine protein kinase [Sandaracinus sp.]|nr:serine/threonine protein kinase [Sandaracinus sp.]MCB9632021.1 serine/threonine protein kinase [Sandaracinus sp.]
MGAFEPGAILVDRYRVERHLGKGTTSDVYLALDFVTEEQVALKHLRIAGERATARFAREAATLAKLQHRSILRIHRHHEDPPLLVMELLVGRTLAAQLASGDRPGRYETRAIGRAVAGALVQVHGAGLVHRDVKPSNILLARDRIVLFDFGLVTGGAVLTSPGQVLGTLAYLAPEVFLGRQASAATDIYALGCVLHELLVGEPPESFSLRCPLRETAERLVREGRPRLPTTRDPELAALVESCLDPDPELRPTAKRIFTKLSETSLIRAHG